MTNLKGTQETNILTSLDGDELFLGVDDPDGLPASAVWTAETQKDYTFDELSVDEDDMSSDSASKLPTQQSVKSYVDNREEAIGIACSDENTALAVVSASASFRMPFAMTLTKVKASVNQAPTGSTIIVDINKDATSVLSTKLTIDATEDTSTTAATPAVISNSSLTDDCIISIDIDQVGSTVAGTGLKVWLIGTRV